MPTFSAFGCVWRTSKDFSWGFSLPPKIVADPTYPIVLIEDQGFLTSPHEIISGLSYSSDGFWRLGIPNLALFEISANHIRVRTLENASPQAVGVYLAGSAMGVVLHLQGIIPMHASTVIKPDGSAALFCGHSGAGKSTISCALALNGYASLSDDVTAIKFDTHGRAWAYPGIGRTKLWGNALKLLDIKSERQIWPEMDKYFVDLPICDRPVPVGSIYELILSDDLEGIEKVKVEGMGRISTLLQHTYRPSFIDILGLKSGHMARVAKLAPQVQISQILRASDQNTVGDIVSLVTNDWI
ncbi:hypothetical protein [Polynucleobacter sp. es-EL-1]|uniref:hypothetical protein n=1 Tax=Polynucleobacter sp. es-EL-1 TaxID=1855652 RepID=UPI001BFD5AED|nr:hypothetical protein [Polynucleobacter sp. es-EL-1]QWE11337.1 hypothetical protein FD974_04225 [Polynucleobacter sp. es-EL-1]